jgi:hypothetical protein
MNEAQLRQSGIRTVTDGKPYYCTFCGMGWNEYGACEDVRCKLESVADAQARFVHVDPPPPQIGNYSNIMRH